MVYITIHIQGTRIISVIVAILFWRLSIKFKKNVYGIEADVAEGHIYCFFYSDLCVIHIRSKKFVRL